MTEPYFKPTSEPIGEFGKACVKHPPEVKTTAWHRFTVALIRSGQERPYGDSVYMADVCFEGGCGSTKAGVDMPFFTKPDESRVRKFACWLTGAKENSECYFDTHLTECRMIDSGETYSTWRITAVTPFTD